MRNLRSHLAFCGLGLFLPLPASGHSDGAAQIIRSRSGSLGGAFLTGAAFGAVLEFFAAGRAAIFPWIQKLFCWRKSSWEKRGMGHRIWTYLEKKRAQFTIISTPGGIEALHCTQQTLQVNTKFDNSSLLAASVEGSASSAIREAMCSPKRPSQCRSRLPVRSCPHREWG